MEIHCHQQGLGFLLLIFIAILGWGIEIRLLSISNAVLALKTWRDQA